MMNEWLKQHLVCPRDKKQLQLHEGRLSCPEDHTYAVVDGIPIMLVDDGSPTHGYIGQSMDLVARIDAGEKPEDVVDLSQNVDGDIDYFVKHELPYSSGNLYVAIKDKLTRYPLPELRLPDGDGKTFLDVGCNWGRWMIPAEQKGYRSVGIDPSLNSILAARRIARQHGFEPALVVGDARFLPFAEDSVDVAFSFGVLIHLNKANVRICLDEMSRVVRPGGVVAAQMANKYGIRCLYHQTRMGFRESREGVDCFYWTPAELVGTFTEAIGETEVAAECFFGLNIQKADMDLMPFTHKMLIRSSELMRGISGRFTPLIQVADSLYLTSINRKNNSPAAALNAWV
jgi:ubiquinone/menaquinone biosynthesis C-methylase UbiE/uncharacterized protein YbaR (Trm112 family)